jgi:hypothetical protein
MVIGPYHCECDDKVIPAQSVKHQGLAEEDGEDSQAHGYDCGPSYEVDNWTSAGCRNNRHPCNQYVDQCHVSEHVKRSFYMRNNSVGTTDMKLRMRRIFVCASWSLERLAGNRQLRICRRALPGSWLGSAPLEKWRLRGGALVSGILVNA